MALNVAHTGRLRSASRGPNADEKASEIANLIRQLAVRNDALPQDGLEGLVDVSEQLRSAISREEGAKDTFRHGLGFQRILEILEKCSDVVIADSTLSSRVLALSETGLSVLAISLDEHQGNQRYFKDYVHGWQALQQSLERLQNALAEQTHDASLGVFLDAVFDLLVKGGHMMEDGSVESRYARVRLPQAANMAMALATALAHNQSEAASERAHNASLTTITHLTALAARSEDNAVALWRAGVASQCLKLTLQESASDEVRLAARRLTVTLSTYGLESLDDVALLCEKACEVDDARQLLLTMLQSSKGPSFMQFDMTKFGYSSVELPSLPRTFPPSTGYSISAWVRIDEYDPACHTTLFGAFDSTQSCFVLIYLEKDSHHLILQTSVRSSRPSVRFKSTRFVAGSWYHVSLVHRRNGLDPTHSPTMLFIDGEFAEQVKCSYPEMPPEHEDRQAAAASSSSIGRTMARRQRPVQAFFGTPHDLAHRISPDMVESRWSLASAQMFASPLTDEIIAVQYRLGPRYHGNMQDCLGPMLTYRASAELNRYNELLHPEKSDRSDITTATEARGSDVMPESRLLISLSPHAVIDLDESISEPGLGLDNQAEARLKLLSQRTRAIVLNAAIPLTNEALNRSYGTGMLAGDPVIAVPQPLDVATWCLAGSVPLLVRLLGSAHTRSSFLQAIATYFECIKDNWRISEAVEKDNGYGMLAMTIRDKLGFESILASSVATKRPLAMLTLQDRQSTPLPILEQILDFIGYNKTKPEDSMIFNPMAYRVLLLDFDTWRRCDVTTQKLYYQQFIHFVNHNRHQVWNHGRLNKMRVVKKLIDVLKSEEVSAEVIASVKEALKALVDTHQAKIHFKELAMFITFGLQDERVVAARSLRHISSMVQFRQRAALWANGARRFRPSTPGSASTHPQQPQIGLSRYELAIHVLQLITDILCEDERSPVAIKRFNRTVPNRWLIHLLAEQDPRIVALTLRIISRSLAVLGPDFKIAFVDKNGGFVTMKHRLKAYWKSPLTWLSCFAILFGRETPAVVDQNSLSVFEMLQAFAVDDNLKIYGEEVLPTLMAMLEAGLRSVVKAAEPAAAEASILKAVIQFLGELYVRSPAFQQFAVESRYIQSLLFVLFPILVGSDRLAAETELQADKHSLSFRGEEVKLRPHSNSFGERPPSVRSLNLEDDPIKRSPSPRVPKNLDGPRRLSSFVMINPNVRSNARPAQFNTTLAPTKPEPVRISIANSLVEALLEVTLNLFTDLVCNRDKFTGIGLFLKVPPGFREHQAYFESYVLVNALSQLWNHLKLHQDLFLQTRVLTNLARYSEHMAEAVFEGWFIDGAQPVLDFTGQVLEYMQQPDIAQNKTVRLCSQYTSCIRVIFLRVTLWRLSELNEVANEDEAVEFLNKMNYWQTILFSSENNERLFTKLICFMLYRKLTSDVHSVRLAAARLWRTVMVQKPSESATLITESVGAEQRHLSTGFMKLVSMDDEDFIQWVDENRAALDPAFVNFLSEAWDRFVMDENKRNESNAAARLAKRRDRLQAWHSEETKDDETIYRFEASTKNWTSNIHAQERVKLQRAVQDHQEIVSHLHAVFERTDKLMKQPCGVKPSTETPKWRLDETEALNRMRCRLLPGTEEHNEMYRPKRKTSVREAPNGNPKLTLNTQATHSSENVMSDIPASPIVSDAAATDGAADQPQSLRPRAGSISNSQLLEGGFEMVDDPNQDHEGAPEDKNRKVMTRLQMGDGVVTLFNISRIIGLEALEGLLVVGKKCLYLQDDFFQRSDGEIVSATQAPEDERDPYVNLISGKDTSGSTKAKHTTEDQEIRHWTWAEVLSISKRRFLSRDVAVEIFFTDGRSYLITCISPKVRDELHKAIVSGAPQVTRSASLIAPEDAWRLDTLRNPEEEPQSLGTRFAGVFNNTPSYAATRKWLKGEMSNFQYLMLINTMAGRTFNDLTQYPVFPWVLADYTSEELDLDNPKTFRNFAKPMGCQTASREAEFKDRYQQFAEMMDGREPPFHYGTHYSSAMIVSSYLIRLQPYVQSYLILQGGNFDHADRLFDSIGKAWSSASRENMSDVRELTPEFFYLPEFLTNVNKYDFGVKQGDGGIVNDVELPPWAKGDPQIFIEKHRKALESPYVSEHLHEWIDLVFGFKQRGEAALEATNVFGHLSYPGATNLEAIEDRVQLLSTIWIIHSFGQTPHQVFLKTHPARDSPRSVAAKLDTLAESLVRLPDPLYESDEKVTGLTFSTSVGRLLCDVPCRLNLLPNCDRFMQWGFADHSIRFFSSNTKRPLGLYEGAHVGAITSTVFSDSKTLITAGADCTIAIWSVTASRDLIEIHPKTYLFGHRKSVTLLAASRVFSTLLSVSTDGQVIIWGLNRLSCIRVLLAAGGQPLEAAKISNISGHIALCQGPNLLVYTINGHLLVRQKICDAEDDKMTCCAFYEGAGNEWMERELIFTGHAHGVANAWTLVTLPDGTWHLQLVKRLNHADASREDGGNTSVAVTAILPMPNAVYTGDENGRVWEWDCIARSASISVRGR